MRLANFLGREPLRALAASGASESAMDLSSACRDASLCGIPGAAVPCACRSRRSSPLKIDL